MFLQGVKFNVEFHYIKNSLSNDCLISFNSNLPTQFRITLRNMIRGTSATDKENPHCTREYENVYRQGVVLPTRIATYSLNPLRLQGFIL